MKVCCLDAFEMQCSQIQGQCGGRTGVKMKHLWCGETEVGANNEVVF